VTKFGLTCYCRACHERRSPLGNHTDISCHWDATMQQLLQNHSTIKQYCSTRKKQDVYLI